MTSCHITAAVTACTYLAVGPDDVGIVDDGAGDGDSAVRLGQQQRVLVVILALLNLTSHDQCIL